MSELNQAVIIAGGKGTRLAEALGMDIPKPMAPVDGVPLLERLICLLVDQGYAEIVLLVHYRAEVIRRHFGVGRIGGANIRILEETAPRGTGGSLLDALPCLEENFLVLYGDTLVDINFGKLVESHVVREAELTIFAHPNDHPQDSDLIECDGDGRVTNLHGYPHPPGREYRNLVNAALYVMNRALLDEDLLPEGPFDIAKHAIPRWIQSGRKVFAFRGDGYIKDMGTPERLGKVERDLKSGAVLRKSGRIPRAAVFLDRDGTMNVEKGHLACAGDLELIPGVGPAIRQLNQAGIPAIVITNQPVIARGEATFEEMDRIHAKLETLLASEGAYVDGLFFCPHHPDKGFPGERPELKIKCDCRKPEIALIEQAGKVFSLDLRRSWFIGDTTLDLECARRAGMRSILVATGSAGKDGKFPAIPNESAPDLASAVKIAMEDLQRYGLGS